MTIRHEFWFLSTHCRTAKTDQTGQTPMLIPVLAMYNVKNLVLSGVLTLCLLVSTADIICKHFGSRRGPTKYGSKLFDTLMIFLKNHLKVNFEGKKQQLPKNCEKFHSMHRVLCITIRLPDKNIFQKI